MLELASPQKGEQDAICRCTDCAILIVMDAQPSCPQSLPARPVVIFDAKVDVRAERVWLN